MPRFVVLRHVTSRGQHWDFMLERGPSLATWSLPEPPDSPGTITAESLPEHRMAYLDYEGPLSGDRGSVTRWDHGSYEIEEQTEAGLYMNLAGEKLSGRVCLWRCPGQPQHWQFSFSPGAR